MMALRILLVEDEPVIAHNMRYVLEKNGHQVLQAEEQADFQPVCAQFHPDLAILNYRLQRWPDGMALARSLRQEFTLPSLLVTGAQPAEMRVSEAYDARIPILLKPFTGSQLCHSVDALGKALETGQARPNL